MTKYKSRKINRHDWSGEEEEYLYSKNHIKFPNRDIELKFERRKQWIHVYFRYVGGEWDKFLTMYKLGHEWYAEQMGVTRESTNEYDVAVQMAFNLI